MTATTPPAGWYGDPWHDGAYRYWDGAAWSVSTAPAGTTIEVAPDDVLVATETVDTSDEAASPGPLATIGESLASRGDLLAELATDAYDALQAGRWPQTHARWRRWVDERCRERPERRPWLYVEAATPIAAVGLGALWVIRPLWPLVVAALITLLGLGVIVGLASLVASLVGHLAEAARTAPSPQPTAVRPPTMPVAGPYLSSPEAELPTRPDSPSSANLWELTHREPGDHLAGNHHVLLAAHAREGAGLTFLTCSDVHDEIHAFALVMAGEVVDSFDRGHWRSTPSPGPAPVTSRCTVRAWRYLHGVKVPDTTHAGRELLHTELGTPHLGHGSITGVLRVTVDG